MSKYKLYEFMSADINNDNVVKAIHDLDTRIQRHEDEVKDPVNKIKELEAKSAKLEARIAKLEHANGVIIELAKQIALTRELRSLDKYV